MDDFDKIPVEQKPHSGSLIQDKPNRLKGETFSIDNLDTLGPGGLNKKRYEDILKEAKVKAMVPFVVQFSKTANIVSKIIKKHLKALRQQNEDHYEYIIITAYS